MHQTIQVSNLPCAHKMIKDKVKSQIDEPQYSMEFAKDSMDEELSFRFEYPDLESVAPKRIQNESKLTQAQQQILNDEQFEKEIQDAEWMIDIICKYSKMKMVGEQNGNVMNTAL